MLRNHVVCSSIIEIKVSKFRSDRYEYQIYTLLKRLKKSKEVRWTESLKIEFHEKNSCKFDSFRPKFEASLAV